MTVGKIEAIARKFAAFLFHPAALAVSAALCVGLLLAVQSKTPINLTDFEMPAAPDSPPAQSAHRGEYKLPLHSYAGPAVLEVQTEPPRVPCRLTVLCEGEPAILGGLEPGRGGPYRYLLFPGTMSRGGRVEVAIATDGGEPAAGLLRSAALSFPKAGYWLIPALHLWVGLFFVGLTYATALALVVRSKRAANACYAAVALVLVLTIHFTGLEVASRLLLQLPLAALALLIAAVYAAGGRPEAGEREDFDPVVDNESPQPFGNGGNGCQRDEAAGTDLSLRPALTGACLPKKLRLRRSPLRHRSRE